MWSIMLLCGPFTDNCPYPWQQTNMHGYSSVSVNQKYRPSCCRSNPDFCAIEFTCA